MANSDIDVSGDYPVEMMPKLVETARRIADSGSCEDSSCSYCPCSCYRGYRCDVGRNQSSGHGPVKNPAWFRAFFEWYREVEQAPISDKTQGLGMRYLEAVKKSSRPESTTARRKRMLSADKKAPTCIRDDLY